MKKKFSFKKALLCYIALWLVLTAVVCIVLWNKCKIYQNGYDMAKKTADPDLFVAQLLPMYAEDNICQIVREDSFDSMSAFVTTEEKEAYLKSLVAGKDVVFSKNEASTERKPVYDIYAEETLVGKVVLSMNTESIEYGFHRFSVKSMDVVMETPELLDCVIRVEGNQDVYVNGTLLTEQNADGYTREEGSQAEKKAAELSGNDLGVKEYALQGLFELPTVVVKNGDQEFTLKEEMEGNGFVFQQPLAVNEEVWERMERGAVKGGKLYVCNANNMASFGELSPFLVVGSDAYNNIQSMQSGLTWAGKPEEFEILSEKMISVKEYSDTMRVCRTSYDVHRVYRGVTYDETLTYDWIFTYSDGAGWQIVDFCLVQ
ncbi:MAG: hypothetical protein MJ105_00865 [Lachnospiraceae bacterium]|nr:hypothetical protein [Lachnospiraceae bacterium]